MDKDHKARVGAIIDIRLVTGEVNNIIQKLCNLSKEKNRQLTTTEYVGLKEATDLLECAVDRLKYVTGRNSW